jgi:type I restriction enzyme S subunit
MQNNKNFTQDWKIEKLDNIFNVFGGTTPSTLIKEFWNGDIPWVTPSDLNNYLQNIYLIQTEKKITEVAVKKYSLNIFSENNILLSTRASIGLVAINKFPVTINQGMTVLVPKNRNMISPFYFVYYFYWVKKYLSQLASGSTFKEISKSTLRNMNVYLPALLEQERIAEILLNMDKSIEEVSKAIEKSVNLKKGLMQKLLINGIGHKEFKISEFGRIPNNWQVKKLYETADEEDKYSFTGGPFGSNLKTVDYKKVGVRIIQLQNIGDGTFNNKYYLYTSEKKANQLYSCNIYPNDIVIAKMAEPLARACKIPNSDRRFLMCSDCIRLSVNKKLYYPDYILYAINSDYFRKNAIKHSTGTTRLRIDLNKLKNLKILIPPSPEQEKIAEILSTIDERIQLLKEKKQKTERIKISLMNELLTGKKRVKL